MTDGRTAPKPISPFHFVAGDNKANSLWRVSGYKICSNRPGHTNSADSTYQLIRTSSNMTVNFINLQQFMHAQRQKSLIPRKIRNNKSKDDDGSRAVFDDVDCFRSQGWDNVIIFDQVIKMINMMWYGCLVICSKMSKTRFRSTTFKIWPLHNL